MTKLIEILLKDGTIYVTKGYERFGMILSFIPYNCRNIIRLNMNSVKSIVAIKKTVLKFDEKCKLIKSKGKTFENYDLSKLF